MQGDTTDWRPLAILAVGYVAITVGVYSAHATPATGYEVSIYRATPALYWAGIAVALTGAVVVTAAYRRFAPLSLFLAGTSVLSVVALPLVRGYHYYGWGDGLTHLGWTREIAAGQSPLELFYPGAHLTAAAIGALGFDLRQSMLLVTVLFALVFFVFVPLTIRAVVGDRAAVLIAAFAGLLLPPIFNFGTSYMFVPYTFAMLYSSFVLYVLARHVVAPIRKRDSRSLLSLGATGGVLTLAGIALILLHSQLMADVLILLVTVAGLQLLYRRLRPAAPIDGYNVLTLETGVLAGLFAAWNLHYGIMFRVVDGTLTALLERSDGGVATTVSQRSGSLQELGASLPEIVAKLFLVKGVFALAAGGIVIAVLLGRARRLPATARRFVVYLGVGGVMLLPLFLFHFVGVSSFFFRHVGFGLVLATLLGSVGLYHASSIYSPGWPTVSTVTAVALALSLLVVFPSPYIYLPNHHVTEAQMDGYEQTFDARSDDAQFAGIRLGPGRYSSAYPDATEGSSDGRISAVAAENVNSSMIDAGVAEQFDRDTYVVATEADRQRELAAYGGLRYSRDDFESLSDQSGLSRVSSNGEFTLYYARAE